MKKIYVLLFLILAIVLAACSKNTDRTGAAVLEDGEKQQVETQAEQTPDCNDNNKCTEDSYDSATKKCVNNPIPSCCGNKKCEEKEGCSTVTYKTKCKEDCGLSCGPNIAVNDPECEDSKCTRKPDGNYLATGDTKLKFSIYNNGEEQTDVTATLKCTKTGGSYDNYFNDRKSFATLTPEKTAYYYIEMKYTEGFKMECDATFTAKNFVQFMSFKINP